MVKLRYEILDRNVKMHKLMIDEINSLLNTNFTDEDINSILALNIKEESIELISKCNIQLYEDED